MRNSPFNLRSGTSTGRGRCDHRIARPRAPRTDSTARRGVASVLAMIFLVVFSSLAVAMSVVAQGNLRTAKSSLEVSRAMSAAETGLIFAMNRLETEAGRFITKKGVLDADYAEDMWFGTYPNDGSVTVLDPDDYVTDRPNAGTGIMHAINDAHEASPHDLIIEAGDGDLPSIDDDLGTVTIQPLAITDEEDGPYFRLRYEMLEGLPMIRVTSTGYDGAISRTLQMDFDITKKIEYAMVSPSRIMIGKNVRVEGPLGSLYGAISGTNDPNEDELSPANGDPLVMRSDFYYLDEDLDDNLDLLYQQVESFDVDGDNRLRPDHPTESQGLDGYAQLADVNSDGYVDDFDLFLAMYDANDDGRVCYDADLANDAGYGVLGVEFEGIDDQLARLVDTAVRDRDGDGVCDYDPDTLGRDQLLGYKDGVLDTRDQYAKVHGRLMFAVAEADWTNYNGASYQNVVRGGVRPEKDEAALKFETTDEELLEITTSMFNEGGAPTWFSDNADGASFAEFDGTPGVYNWDGAVTGGQLLAGINGGGTYTAPSAAPWEAVPFGSFNAYDYYDRPIFEDMTFTNVRIPPGCNGLFINCTFVGVTYIETEVACTHQDWNYAGALAWDDASGNGDGVIDDAEISVKFPDLPPQADIDAGDVVADTRTVSNNIRFHSCTFLGSIAGDAPAEYTHWRNKIQMTGNCRLYIDETDDDLLDQDDADDLVALLQTISASDIEEMEKSSIMLPGWSLDVGNFTNETEADPDDTATIKLKGTIVTGIFDLRGTADVHGTLLNTYRPIEGAGPLAYGGTADAFNATIGYFGPDDGDGEGEDPNDADFEGFGEITLRYDPDAKLPDGIPWPLTISADPSTYVEGAVD